MSKTHIESNSESAKDNHVPSLTDLQFRQWQHLQQNPQLSRAHMQLGREIMMLRQLVEAHEFMCGVGQRTRSMPVLVPQLSPAARVYLEQHGCMVELCAQYFHKCARKEKFCLCQHCQNAGEPTGQRMWEILPPLPAQLEFRPVDPSKTTRVVDRYRPPIEPRQTPIKSTRLSTQAPV